MNAEFNNVRDFSNWNSFSEVGNRGPKAWGNGFKREWERVIEEDKYKRSFSECYSKDDERN